MVPLKKVKVEVKIEKLKVKVEGDGDWLVKLSSRHWQGVLVCPPTQKNYC